MLVIFEFMKRNYKVLLLVLGLSISLWSFIPNKKTDPEKDKLLLELLTFVLEKAHYSPASIDDNFSKGVYKNYLETLDPSKRFFIQSDITEFSKFETQIDDQIRNRDLSFFDLTYSRLMQRIKESKNFSKYMLVKPIDYIVDESFNVDYEKAPYANSLAELMEKWRKQVKLSTLSTLVDKLKLEENKKNGVVDSTADKISEYKAKKLKPQSDSPPKSYEELEKETRADASKTLDQYYENTDELDRSDYFGMYINTIAERFDPHTSYFAPEAKEKFDVEISGTLEGIGARLQKKDDLVEISELISGGPAWRGKELEEGDLIMKVAQGKEIGIDVAGMKLNDVVKKIKGHKGTEVVLTVKKQDGTIKEISIIRDIVELEETYVKSSIVEKNGLKYGVIYLPKFYINFENKDGRDAGKDMAIEVKRLKEEGVYGIVLDVRNDGGGSLRTVVDIAGLFIADGPIVQIKSSNKSQEVLYDRDKKIEWDGPLVVMVNGYSASASEILAAAIQDYKRGIIIGSKQTYGKGTVQNVSNLNDFVRNSNVGDLGALKTTVQKFYRINGGSTQLEGVSSDVAMPDRYMYLKNGERDVDNAMPWDKIDATQYNVWDKQAGFNSAIANSKARIEKNSYFKLIEKNAKWLDERNKEFDFSLNINTFKSTRENLENTAKSFKIINKYSNNLNFTSLPYEAELMKTDLALKDKREDWHKNLSRDIYIEEAINVLEDLQVKTSNIKKNAITKNKKDKFVKT
ncbi:MAG: carboxy terminal-processing peptidase [Flavobacterium sp.]|nr:carboxy terminal-processing peptidase [Flavobacterium sp.]